MKTSSVFLVLLLAVFFSYTAIAQEFGSLRRGYERTIPEKVESPTPAPLHGGTYTIGQGGYFPTIQSAFDKLSRDGVDGRVTLELINTTYGAFTGQYGYFLNGPIRGASLSNRVIIKPAENKNVTIIGNNEVVMLFVNTSYVILDGVAFEGPTTLTIRVSENQQFSYNDCVGFWNNSDHNIVQNITFVSEDCTRGGTGVMIWNQPGSLSPPESNLILNNFIQEAGVGIFLLGYGVAATSPEGNIIKGNIIGSETDSKIAWGIQSEITLNTIIEKNLVQNVSGYNNYFSVGINVYGGYGAIIRKNIVHNISTSNGVHGSAGILLSGHAGPGYRGSNNLVCNNMIYDIISSSTQSEASLAGIQIRGQYFPKIYFNSVYLNGIGNGANPEGSGALYVFENCEIVDVKNNILVNTRDESPYCASSIYFYGNYNMIHSNNNDLYYVQNQSNCLVRSTRGDYFTLTDWKSIGQDENSISEMPFFVGPHLHMNRYIPTNIESGATPMSGICTDCDGELRHITTPDIGADEFFGDIISEVKSPILISYSLEQNHPNPFNPATTIKYQIPERSFVSLKVYDILGNFVTQLVKAEKQSGFYEIEFDASGLTSGIYIYQLKANEFVETKKMLLLK
ncbi:MAG: T9SS type A sorting domain-containing protein [Ignavibacteria bacterium]|nr:T9SS type A sorting domain-containing protein [Ignavibacteria bacterium]